MTADCVKNRALVSGLLIFRRYKDGQAIFVQMDELLSGPPPGETNEEDRKALELLGWHAVDEYGGCWGLFL